MTIHIVEVFGFDSDGRFDAQKIDSVYPSRKGANDYINSLSSYDLRGKTHRFERDVRDEDSYRSVITKDGWRINFMVISKEVKS